MKRGSLEHWVVIAVGVVTGLSVAWLLLTYPSDFSAARRAAVLALSLTFGRSLWESIRVAISPGSPAPVVLQGAKRGSLEHWVVIAVAGASGLTTTWLLLTGPPDLAAARLPAVIALSLCFGHSLWECIRVAIR